MEQGSGQTSALFLAFFEFNLTAFTIVRICHHLKTIPLNFGLSPRYLFCYFHCNEYIYSYIFVQYCFTILSEYMLGGEWLL